MSIKKNKPLTTSNIKKTEISGIQLRFSFLYFDEKDEVLCPNITLEGYTHSLMRRLRALSGWTVSKFIGQDGRPYEQTIRNHDHIWEKTNRPAGFAHLKRELRDEKGWQFCLENPKHGRVHGIILGDTFYVIWLDIHHQLYPMEVQSENSA